MTGLEVMLIVGAAKLAWAIFKPQCGGSGTCVLPAPAPRPGRVVGLVGRTGAGKSSTGNALVGREVFAVGAEHGTTRSVAEARHADGYVVRDTPGSLDDVDYLEEVSEALEDVSLVVYTTPGQLYRAELEALEAIHDQQRAWDASSGTPGARHLAVFVTFGDVKGLTMPSRERRRESDAVRAQVASWVPSERVVFGSVPPASASRPIDIGRLSVLVRDEMSRVPA